MGLEAGTEPGAPDSDRLPRNPAADRPQYRQPATLRVESRRPGPPPLGVSLPRAVPVGGRVSPLPHGAGGIDGRHLLHGGRTDYVQALGYLQLPPHGPGARRHRDRSHLVRPGAAADASGHGGNLSAGPARLRRPRVPTAGVEVRCPERPLEACRRAVRLPLRGHLPAAHGRQRTQPRHRLVRDDRRRLGGCQAGLRGVAAAGELRLLGPPAPLARGNPRRPHIADARPQKGRATFGWRVGRPATEELGYVLLMSRTPGDRRAGSTFGWRVGRPATEGPGYVGPHL